MDLTDARNEEASRARDELFRLRDELSRMSAGTSGVADRAELAAAIAALDRVITSRSSSSFQNEPLQQDPELLPRGRPVRALILDSLEDLRWPSYTRELGLYCQARYGRAIPPTRFGTLATDEIKSYQRGRRPSTVWLCFGLTSNRAESIRRLWGRSDWPLEQRVVAPTTGRVQHLKLTARLCEIALEVADTAADPDMLRIIAADHARDLPGVKFRRGDFPLENWRDLARELLSKAEPTDEQARQDAAGSISRLPELHQLFGVFETVEGHGRVRTAKWRRR
jgi:hypothetical protein